MSVYFADSDDEALPASLPCQFDPESKDIFLQADLHRRERQRLTRCLVTCDRALGKSACQKLETFKCQQALRIVSSDALVQQRDRMKILEMRMARCVHLPVSVQEKINREKDLAQEEMSLLSEALEKKLSLLDIRIKQDSNDFCRLRDVRRSLQNMLSTVEEKSKLTAASPRSYAVAVARDKVEGIDDLSYLAEFLRKENAFHLFDRCTSQGIMTVQKLMSLTHEEICAMQWPEEDIACMLYIVSNRNKSKETNAVNVLTQSFPALFPHRGVPSANYSEIHEKLKSCMIESDLSNFKKLLSKCSREMVNFQANDGWTLLHRVASKAVATCGQTRFVHECQEKSTIRPVHVIECLLQAHADVHMRNKYGRTALHYAAMEGNISICMLLIDAKSNISELDSYGMSPLQHASLMKKGSWHEVCKLLNGEGNGQGTLRFAISKSKHSKRKGKRVT